MTPNLDTRKSGLNGRSTNTRTREPTFEEYITIFLRGKWIILLSFVLVTLATAVYTFTTSPVYESNALVLIDMKGMKGSLPFSLDLTGEAALSKITNEIEILKSRLIAHAVAQKLIEKKFLTRDRKVPIPIITFLADDDSTTIIGSPPEIVERLDKAVDFTPIRESDIIKISARSTDPHEAALLANVYAESYVERNMNASRNRSRAVREFLQDQRESKKQALDTTESALQNYMRSSGTVALDEETKKIVEQQSLLQANRDAIDLDRSSREKTLNSYKEELARQEPAVARSIGESNDSYVRLLQEQLAKLEVQRDVIVAQNPSLVGQKMYLDKVDEIEKQIAALKVNLQERTSKFLKSLVPSLPGEGSAAFLAQTKQKIIEQQIELDGLAARKRALDSVIGDYERQFNRIPQKSIDLARLQRARLSTEKLYILIEEKYNEAAITEKSEFGYVDIVDPALVPIKPVSPKVPVNLFLAVLIGLGLGVAIVLIKERIDIRVQTPEDLRRFGFKTITTVARMVSGTQRGRKGFKESITGKHIDPHLITFYSPRSPLAESFRQLRTNIQFADQHQPPTSVIVTSAWAAEGKSTTVANLAAAFAQGEKRALLVDADLRQPSLNKLLNIHSSPGLTEFLLNESTFDEVIQRHVLGNLDVVASGSLSPNPSELTGSQSMQAFINLSAQAYDIVLFDTAPLFGATDAAILAALVGGTILVVSSGVTRTPDVEQAIDTLGNVGAKVVAVVLNNFDARKAYGGYPRSSRYTYGYGRYAQDMGGNGTGRHHVP